MSSKYDELIAELEQITKNGQRSVCLQKIRELVIRRIPREFKEKFADLALRNWDPLLASRILNPVIRGAEGQISPPSNQELMYYGNCLISLGSNKEAIEILKRVDRKKLPKADLFLCFAYFGLWEYKKTIPILRRYANNPHLTRYERTIGKVNLLAALLSDFESLDQKLEKENLINYLFEECQSNSYSLLLGNVYELKAQLSIMNGNYQDALFSLDKATELLSKSGGAYLLFVQKWRFICNLRLNKFNIDQALFEVQILKQKAIKLKVWEVNRDLDLYVSWHFGLNDQIKQIVDATAAKSYQHKVQFLTQLPVVLDPHIKRDIFVSSDFGIKAVTESPIRICIDSKTKMNFKNYPSCLRLLQALLRDGYKPMSLGQIFSEVCPGEYFNPMSAEHRINATIFRLRALLKLHKIPLNIFVRDKSVYLLPSTSGHQLFIDRDFLKSEMIRKDIFLDFKGRHFSFSDFHKKSDLSVSKARSVLDLLIKKKRIQRIGNTKNTKYRLSNHRKKTA